MLKRRKRIQKYIKALKLKQKGLNREDIEKLKLEADTHPLQRPHPEVKQERVGASIPKLTFDTVDAQDLETNDKPLWQDEEEEFNLPNRNMFKKLQLEENTTEKQYEERLRRFYNTKYGVQNWATAGDGEHEKDLNDLLNHEEVYAHGLQKREGLQVEFISRTT